MTALEDSRAGDLSAEELLHLAACKRAVEQAGPPPPMEYEKRDWTIEERLYATAQNFRSWGADEDLIGADLAWKLVQKGYSTEEAEELLRSVGVTWTAERAA